jgi:hypothetical protein
MIAGLNASELSELALLLVAVGALSGFPAGVFGIGGAHAMSKRTLEWAFGCYFFIVGSRFVTSLVSGH